MRREKAQTALQSQPAHQTKRHFFLGTGAEILINSPLSCVAMQSPITPGVLKKRERERERMACGSLTCIKGIHLYLWLFFSFVPYNFSGGRKSTKETGVQDNLPLPSQNRTTQSRVY